MEKHILCFLAQNRSDQKKWFKKVLRHCMLPIRMFLLNSIMLHTKSFSLYEVNVGSFNVVAVEWWWLRLRCVMVVVAWAEETLDQTVRNKRNYGPEEYIYIICYCGVQCIYQLDIINILF